MKLWSLSPNLPQVTALRPGTKWRLIRQTHFTHTKGPLYLVKESVLGERHGFESVRSQNIAVDVSNDVVHLTSNRRRKRRRRRWRRRRRRWASMKEAVGVFHDAVEPAKVVEIWLNSIKMAKVPDLVVVHQTSKQEGRGSFIFFLFQVWKVICRKTLLVKKRFNETSYETTAL